MPEALLAPVDINCGPEITPAVGMKRPEASEAVDVPFGDIASATVSAEGGTMLSAPLFLTLPLCPSPKRESSLVC